eukprot:IDg4346t1
MLNLNCVNDIRWNSNKCKKTQAIRLEINLTQWITKQITDCSRANYGADGNVELDKHAISANSREFEFSINVSDLLATFYFLEKSTSVRPADVGVEALPIGSACQLVRSGGGGRARADDVGGTERGHNWSIFTLRRN